jgi:uncharacterized protein
MGFGCHALCVRASVNNSFNAAESNIFFPSRSFKANILARAYSQLRVAIFTDGATGNLKQARALATGLCARPSITEHVVRLRGIRQSLAPQFWRIPIKALQLTPPLDAPTSWAFAIGCGRAGAIALDGLKSVAPAVKTLQILDPKCNPARFDAVICPQHDQLSGANVWQTFGAIHAIDDQWLAMGQMQLQIPAAKRLVLLGAPTRHARYPVEAVMTAIQSLSKDGLCISTSRRTPSALTASARNAAQHFYDGSGENPYQRWLSTAEEIYVTADSVNMITEAAATHARIVLLGSEYSKNKIAAFAQTMQARLTRAIACNDMPDLFQKLRQHFSLIDQTSADTHTHRHAP